MTYFSNTATGRDGDGTYTRLADLPVATAGNGVRIRAFAGNRLMLSQVTIAPHGVAAVHTHDEEQLGLVISGSCVFKLDGVARRLGPGDIYHAPPGVPHGARAGEDECVIVDLFAPARQALLELLAANNLPNNLP